MRILGIMSGTSIDGVDYVICRFQPGKKLQLERHWALSFPPTLRKRLQAAAANQASSHQVGQLHHDLGRFYAAGVNEISPVPKIDLVGLHGQTIFHQPRLPSPATLQIGEPVYLAELLRAPVISNFRAADLALGGQGAPLATIFHRRVFAKRGKHIAVNNLGGISNVTSIDWRSGHQPEIMAFDTGPANILIDLAIRKASHGRRQFDRGGMQARKGIVCARLVERWLKHPYFKKKPPKSTGRELFGEEFLASRGARDFRLTPPDLISSLTELTARALALNYHLHLKSWPDEVILCGGGALNPVLFARITDAIHAFSPESIVRSSSELGWAPQVIEAAAFALLAQLASAKQPGNIPATTGAKREALLGQWTFPP
jgi:anhydro-N-acetylmuramic acid kinase